MIAFGDPPPQYQADHPNHEPGAAAQTAANHARTNQPNQPPASATRPEGGREPPGGVFSWVFMS